MARRREFILRDLKNVHRSSPASDAPTASPLLAALRSTHGRGTPVTLPPSGSVPRGRRPDARRGLPRHMGPLEAGSETVLQRLDWSGDRVEIGTLLRLHAPM